MLAERDRGQEPENNEETARQSWLLTIATDDLDFAHDAVHLDQIGQRIVDRLQGKETLTLRG